MWGSYCEDVLTKREPYRQDHLAGLAKQKESGILITIGPTKDVTQVFAIYEEKDFYFILSFEFKIVNNSNFD